MTVGTPHDSSYEELLAAVQRLEEDGRLVEASALLLRAQAAGRGAVHPPAES